MELNSEPLSFDPRSRTRTDGASYGAFGRASECVLKCPATSIDLGSRMALCSMKSWKARTADRYASSKGGQRLRGRAREIPVTCDAVRGWRQTAPLSPHIFDHHLGEQASFIADNPRSHASTTSLKQ